MIDAIRKPMSRVGTAAVHATLILALSASAIALDALPAFAGVQTKEQQKCINEMTKRGLGVTKTQGKDSDKCLKNAIAGKTGNLGNEGQTQNAQSCLTNDVSGKVAKAVTKLGESETKKCLTAPEQVPGFGYTGSAITADAGKQASLDLTADIFGSDLDLVTTNLSYPDEIAKSCQLAVLKNTNKFLDKLGKTANKEIKLSLKGGKVAQASNSAEITVNALDSIVSDAKGKIQKESNKLSAKITDACNGTGATMASLFAGSCSGSATPSDVADCADVRARCRFCEGLGTTIGTLIGCDQFDDGAVNASCSGAAASAREITSAGELITGPLAHGKVGDYLLENDVARFIVQDVGQRDMYSVGAFGGNLIDAELVGAPGLDNFLEIQPAVNAETVINAQTIEIVNDGSNGAPAIIRTCGPDDLLDFVNPSAVVEAAGIPYPSIADDRDSLVEGCTSYILESGSTAVQMVTTIFNIGTGNDRLLVGDFINAAGEVELWGSGTVGIGEQLTADLGVLSFIGFGEATGVDYAHVTLPEPSVGIPSSFFSTSGVAFVLHSQSLIASLLGTPAWFQLGPGESRSFDRYFGVGDGSGANAIDLENRVKGVTSGVISGCVTVGGVAAPGARVGIGPVNAGAFTALASNWTTDATGCYSGTLAEGDYGVAGWREGTPYEGGGTTPLIHNVTIADGVPVVQDIALPATGRLSVSVVDAASNPLPARVSVVGFDPSPELVFVAPGVLGNETTGMFRDQNDIVPFGLSAARYTDASGIVAFDVEPGSYHVYVSRGTEYSRYDTPVTITAGATTNVAAQIAAVLDTTGFLSSDFHVHGINSADSRVSHSDRVRQFAGEGVDNIIMTDHHAHTDLDPIISALGYDGLVTSTVGEEVTTWDTGHYNAYPMTVDPNLPSGGSSDWGKAAPPGEDFPSAGNYIANPVEVEQIILNNPTATADTVVQINHIDSHFVPMEIDTSLVPPSSGLTNVELIAFRMQPGSGNLFHHFPALEVWNGDSRGHQSSFLNERIGIWFNLMNQGLLSTAIADTDTHRFQNLGAAGARTWTSSSTDDPSLLSETELSQAVLVGRAIGGQGAFVQTRLVANENPALIADLTQTGATQITITDPVQGVDLEIDVQAPIWAEFDRIDIYANASTIASPTSAAPELFSATPTATLIAGIDFVVSQVNVVPAVAGAERLETSVTVPFTNLSEDTWFVVVVRGSDGVSEPMFPVFPSNLSSASNTTLANLTDGNLGESGVLALAYTNALFVDADGVPGFQAPLAP